MSELRSAEDDVDRTLGVANEYLEAAENVLWNTSKETETAEVAEALESLTRDVWDLQHRLMDLQRELD